MNIYEVKFDVENYRILVPVDESELDGGNLWINGTLKLASWRAPEMRYSEPQGNEGIADITQITPGFFAFNAKAMDALGDILEKYGELLDLPIDGGSLNVFNPHHTVDCLDEDASTWNTRRDGSRGSRLVKAVFDKSKIKNAAVFQVPQLVNSILFVSEEFKQNYENNRLTGLVFS